MNSKFKAILLPIIFFILIIFLWEIIVVSFHIPNYLLPAPHKIAVEIARMGKSLLKDTAITMIEAVLGFILGCGIGVLTAIGFAHSKTMKLSMYPYAIALKTIPIVAIAPLLILWFGNGMPAKIVMSALICYFPVIVNTVKGLKSVSPESLDLMDSLSATKWQVFTKLRWHNALPYIFSALKISATLAVIGAIVGELAGANKGIGYVILVSSYRLETNMLFAAIVMSSIGGILFFGLIALLEKRILYWQEDKAE